MKVALGGALGGVGDVGGKLAGEAVERLLGRAWEEARLHAVAYLDRPLNHDLERSLRFSMLVACLAVVNDEAVAEQGAKFDDRGAPPDTFTPDARAWLHGRLGALDELPKGAHGAEIEAFRATLDTALPPRHDPRDTAEAWRLRQAAELAMWVELTQALPGAAIPPGFQERFASNDANSPGWFAYAIAFLRASLKDKPGARNAFFVAGLSALKGAVRRIEEAQTEEAERARGADANTHTKLDELPHAITAQLMAALRQSGVLSSAAAEGLAERTVLALAQRLNPATAANLEQAVREVEHAVEIALTTIRRGERPASNEDAFVDAVLAEVARRTRSGKLDDAAQAVDDGLAELEIRAAEQRDAMRRARATLLEAGINQDLLRRDAEAVAKRVEALVALDQPVRAAWAPALRTRWDAFHKEGRDKGLNLSLEIAIAMARRMLATAATADERGVANNLFGIALHTLGARESGTARVEEAVATYRAALEEYRRERVPLDWALTQNNLGMALHTLGTREIGTVRLEQAVAANRAALEERTRERGPLEWAQTQNNLGNALKALGDRESGTARLEDAVAAYRAALEERTRERGPLDWALTQNNLGAALEALGARESSTTRLEDAMATYHAVLEEWTRDRVPFPWALTMENLAIVEATWGNQTKDPARWRAALQHVEAALEEYRRANAEYHIEKATRLRDSLLAKLPPTP
ncbi:tetratricopeptide repeat protein [Roseococcus suduntuyensis]|uniref:Tetratricopeptide (TPR) repeat protein n=1 Tax=Roseococcus suduntuyensis TaxID=455361 RepID=A0A840AB59_9PROT|nr:tetratricopeptide repeat protein [Roseococcus suduntuyensis]MBB3898391.1 tetratricopeptide (TPR) repeat protein [Roseococcus suduntuyensis]